MITPNILGTNWMGYPGQKAPTGFFSEPSINELYELKRQTLLVAAATNTNSVKEIAKGFIIYGSNIGDLSGHSVSSAGDVNGDGLDDVIIGAPGHFHKGFTGKSFVVFGKTNGATIDLSLIALTSNTDGFVINGVNANDQSGYSVSSAGDVNGDGLDDLVVGASEAKNSAGQSFVVFGKTSGTAVNLSDIAPASGAGTGGFVINGQMARDATGRSVSSAGDVNGDGLDDVIVCAVFATPGHRVNAGKSYVIFGKKSGTAINLLDIDRVSTIGKGGFVINGEDPNDYSGTSVSSAGDVNGDGLADLIVGAPYATYAGKVNAGKSYVVFGKTSDTAIELRDIAKGKGGFVINGENTSDHSGHSVSSAGDVNGDGLDDLIIGAPYVDHRVGSNINHIIKQGRSFVVFGKKSGIAINLSDIDAEISIVDLKQWATTVSSISSSDAVIQSAMQATGAPDSGFNVRDLNQIPGNKESLSLTLAHNQTGTITLSYYESVYIKEVIVREIYNAGTISKLEVMKEGSFVTVYSKSSGNQHGGTMTGVRPYRVGDTKITLDNALDYSSNQIRLTLGDSTHKQFEIDAVQLIGSTSLDTIATIDGFVINGTSAGDQSGYSVSSAGDVNGDGLDDLIIGAYAVNSWAGESFVVFGQKNSATIDLTDVAKGNGGFVINGDHANDYSGYSVSSAGDVNGDGLDDLIIGANKANNATGGADAGSSFVVFGKTDTKPVHLADIRHHGGIAAHAIDFKGSDSNETFVGSKADELFVAGRGNDTLTGNGGTDVFNAGAGDDTIIINADNLAKLNDDTLSNHLLASINGGSGNDILSLAGNHLILDLTTIGNGRIRGIETIDLTNLGGNALILNLYNLLDLASETNILKVTGNSSDVVRAIGFSNSGVTKIVDGITYTVYSHVDAPRAGLWMQQDLLFPPTLSATPAVTIDGESSINLTLTFNRNITGLTNGTADHRIFGEEGLRVTAFWSGTDNTNTRTISYTFDEHDHEHGEVSIDETALKNTLVAHIKDITGNAFIYMENGGNIPNISIPTSKGFSINGEKKNSLSGTSVSSAGDVNGDGLDDLIVGAPGHLDKYFLGRSYVVFGKTNGSAVDLSNIAPKFAFGEGGFVINENVNGPNVNGPNGHSVSSAGDVNGDGLDDLIVGAMYESPNAEGVLVGRSYVVFGKTDGAAVNLADISSSATVGFVINGEENINLSGSSVSSAGDVNGDGLDDLIVGSSLANSTSAIGVGKSYVIFGKKSGTEVNLSDIAQSSNEGGFVINGEKEGDNSGTSVSSAGDVNGDGLADLIIGSISAGKSDAGKSFVVFGKASGTAINLSDISAGIKNLAQWATTATASSQYSTTTWSANQAIGAPNTGLNVGDNGADINKAWAENVADKQQSNTLTLRYDESVYIQEVIVRETLGAGTISKLEVMKNGVFVTVYTKSGSHQNGGMMTGVQANKVSDSKITLDSTLDYLSNKIRLTVGNTADKWNEIDAVQLIGLDAVKGFTINGHEPFDKSGIVSSAGDVNGDGLDDVIVGAYSANSAGKNDTGGAYVVFGKKNNADIDLLDIVSGSSMDGFAIHGGEAHEGIGLSVSSAGDVNGDGLDDVIVGTKELSRAFVIFGKTNGSAINVSNMGADGFVIHSEKIDNPSGLSVSSAGDVNGDGLDDLIVGVKNSTFDGIIEAGKSFVVFGKKDSMDINLIDLDQYGISTHAVDFHSGVNSDTLTGTASDELFVAGRNNDILIGNGGTDVFNAGAGDDTIRINADNVAKLNSNLLGSNLLASVNGGNGNDTLVLVGHPTSEKLRNGINLDLTIMDNSRIKDIEAINMTGDSSLKLNLYDLLDLSSETNTLKVKGNASDSVNAIGFNNSGIIHKTDDTSYAIYHHSDTNIDANVALWIQLGIQTTVVL